MFRGNVQSKAPFIIQLSKGARNYTDKRMLEAMIRTAEEIFPEAIFAVHLDHGDEETCYDCIDSGFYSSVMIDASHESFDENVAITKRVVDRAHRKGISVEAELGQLGGVEEDIKVDEGHACLTNPDEAVRIHQANRLRLARGCHRHQPRRLQIQRPASHSTSTSSSRSIQKADSGDADRDARQLQRADRRSRADQRRRRQTRSFRARRE